MKKHRISMFLVGVLCFIFSMRAGVAIKPWTFLVYIAAANDLNTYALYDLQEMMKVGSNQNLNIVVYLTIQQDGQPKKTRKLYINKNGIQQIGPDFVRDSGDVATLAEALQWACLDYPSERLAVVLWDHGSGPLNRNVSKGVCYDFDTGHYLTDRDCLSAFSWVKDMVRGGKKMDIIACDACLLASIEMAYTFSSCADYFVASEETIPGNGFQYEYILSSLAAKILDPLSLSKLMVTSYDRAYSGTLDYTLSATDLNALTPLVDNVNAVAQILSSQLKGKNGAIAKGIIRKCIKSSPSFDQGIYIDACQLYKNLLKFVSSFRLSKTIADQFKRTLVSGITLFSHIIKANVTSKNHRLAGGLSIYCNKRSIDPSYYGLYWTEKNPNWLQFLEALSS